MAAAAQQEEIELTFGTSTEEPLVIRVSLAKTILSLRGKNITTVPSEIGNLVNLQTLLLDGNQLTALPREIGNLVNLQVLKLRGNKLTTLPSEIGNLVNLQTLWLDGNQLTALPREIGNLVNLQWLNLGNNQLTAIPREIGRFVNLKLFCLSNNQLSVVPPEIGLLTSLSSLSLRNNQLASLPRQTGNLISLKKLQLDGNPFTGDARLKALADRGNVNVAKEVHSLFVPGPLSEVNACHTAFETAAARAGDLVKASVRAQRELEAAADAAAEAVRKVDSGRAAVEDLKHQIDDLKLRLGEQLHSLKVAKTEAAHTEKRRAVTAEQSRRALEEAQRAEEAMRKAQEARDKAGRRAAELSAALSKRDVSVLSVRDVSDVLRELGLSEHVVAAFEENEIDGVVLRTLNDEEFLELGLSDSASRQRLRHAVSTVDACGQLRLAGVALEQIAARAGSEGERDAVLIAGWDAERVGRWLESQKTPVDVREKLAAGGVTGERLLHTDKADLELLGIKAMGAQKKLRWQIDAIRKSHFDALRSFFGSRSSSSSTGAAAASVASPAPSVSSSSSSKAATGAAGEGSGSTAIVGDEEEEGGSGSEGVQGLFVCPISLEVMERPVVAADGFVYERTAIEQWLRTQQDRGQPTTSPMTNAPMAAEPLVQLNTLRSEIIAWKQHHHRL